MSYCKVCGTSRDVTQESLLDGRHILLCKTCRRYLQGLLRSCETCLDFNNAYKSASSRLIKKEFPEVRNKLWKEMFWSKSYCLLTTGGAPIETIRKYIENQGR